MENTVKLPTKNLYAIILASGFIIFFSSLEAIMAAKDSGLYDAWITKAGSDADLGLYISSVFMTYFLKIMIPAALSVYAIAARNAIGVNSLFVFIWSVLVAGGGAYAFIGRNTSSVFFYLVMAGYAILLLSVLSVSDAYSSGKYK
jgi:hypothetical protein